jgi:hypothetical protein
MNSSVQPTAQGNRQAADLHPRTTLPVEARRPDLPPSAITRHVSRVAASARLEDALRSIAVDLLGANDLDELPPDCADWVAATTRAAVSCVCQAALGGLVHALDSLLVGAPPDVARRLDEARIRHEAGFT